MSDCTCDDCLPCELRRMRRRTAERRAGIAPWERHARALERDLERDAERRRETERYGMPLAELRRRAADAALAKVRRAKGATTT